MADSIADYLGLSIYSCFRDIGSGPKRIGLSVLIDLKELGVRSRNV